MEAEENMDDKKKENCEAEAECNCETPCECEEGCNCEEGCCTPEQEEKSLTPLELAQQANDLLLAEVERLKNEYAKAYADTENMRKRLQTEFDQAKKYRIQSFALDVLPVIDNLERALLAPASETDSLQKGVEMIHNQLLEALRKEGVEEIEAKGLPFDPNFHQALMAETVEGMDAGMVVEVLQKGYKLKDRILRASMVKVSD